MQREVTAEMLRLVEAGEPFVVATLVDAHGSTPQKVGARLLLRPDGTTVGTLGGGCIEAEVYEVAQAALASGEPKLLDFTLNEDIAVDYGLACGGTERIFVDPTVAKRGDQAFIEKMLRASSGDHRAVVVTVIGSDGTTDGRGRPSSIAGAGIGAWEDGSVDGDIGPVQARAAQLAQRLLEAPRPKSTVARFDDGTEVFADVFAEAPEVIIVGGGHVGRAVATVAHTLGYRIAVIDDRADFANEQRFPEAESVIAGDVEQAVLEYPAGRNSAVIIVTRGHKYDYQALSAAARGEAGYVGLMGSRRKVALIYRQLLEDGIPEERLRDIHAPIGLDIGAISPEEIAVSIMAEITMDRLGGTGLPMRDEHLLERARPKTVA